MPAPYGGGCQCGAVRYVLTAEPIRTVACHCKECQRQSGSAFGMSMIVPETSLTVTGLTKCFTRIADNGNQNTGVSVRSVVSAFIKSRNTSRMSSS
jgi:hypothetical protein